MATSYKVVKKIGQGGMGVVYLAIQEPLGREIALKFLPKEFNDPQRRRRFEREVDAAIAIDHPNIIKILDRGVSDEQLYYAMEFLDGYQTVKDLVKDEAPVPWARAVEIVGQILQALERCEEARLIHRDIKSENVMIDARGHVKVMDFGLVKPLDATVITEAGKALGTPSYMAPEIFLGKPVTHSVDLFATGVVLYELVTGRKPFPGATIMEIAKAILQSTPRPIGELAPESAAYQPLVDGFLAKYPEERFASAREAREALTRSVEAAMVSELVAEDRPPPRSVRQTKFVPRVRAPLARPPSRRIGARVAGVLVMGLLGAGAWVALRGPAVDLSPGGRAPAPLPSSTPSALSPEPVEGPPVTPLEAGQLLARVLDPAGLGEVERKIRRKALDDARQNPEEFGGFLRFQLRFGLDRPEVRRAATAFGPLRDEFFASPDIDVGIKRRVYMGIEALADLEAAYRVRRVGDFEFPLPAASLASERWGMAPGPGARLRKGRALVILWGSTPPIEVTRLFGSVVRTIETGLSRNVWIGASGKDVGAGYVEGFQSAGERPVNLGYDSGEPLDLGFLSEGREVWIAALVTDAAPQNYLRILVAPAGSPLEDQAHLRSPVKEDAPRWIYHRLDPRVFAGRQLRLKILGHSDPDALDVIGQQRLMLDAVALVSMP